MVQIKPWLLISVWFLVLLLIEKYIHFRKLPHKRLNHSLVNGGYFMIGAIFNRAFMFGLSAWITNFSSVMPAMKFPGRFLLLFLVWDLWTYTWHRMNHEIPFFWRFHKVHHADREMDITTALRFHIGEFFFSNGFKVVLILLLGITIKELILFELIITASALFHHTSIDLGERADERLSWFVVTPRFHHVHHSDYVEETNSNYSTVLTMWDRMFGTFKSKSPSLITIGLTEYARTPDFVEGLRLPLK